MNLSQITSFWLSNILRRILKSVHISFNVFTLFRFSVFTFECMIKKASKYSFCSDLSSFYHISVVMLCLPNVASKVFKYAEQKN